MKKSGSGIMLQALPVLMFLLICVCTVRIVPFAHAAWEPEDDFYIANKDKCVYLSRSFYANGDGGYLSIKKEPGSNKEVAEFKNGEILKISYTCGYNGEIWGIAEFPEPGNLEWITGWIPMDQLVTVYDYISFEDDHGSEFYRYSGSVDMLFKPENIVFWKWPGSGEISWILQAEWRDPGSDEIFLIPSSAFVDSEGREWGFFNDVYSNRNSWVCLSDPSNLDIPAFNPAPKPVLKQPGEYPRGAADLIDTIPVDEQPGGADQSTNQAVSPLILIIIIIVVLAAVSFLLLSVFCVSMGIL